MIQTSPDAGGKTSKPVRTARQARSSGVLFAIYLWLAVLVAVWIPADNFVVWLLAICASAATAQVLLRKRFQAGGSPTGFREMFGAASEPMFLVSDDGTIIERNRAANRLGAGTQRLAELLESANTDASAVVYRLGSKAALHGEASETINLNGTPAKLVAQRTGSDLPQIWQIRPRLTQEESAPEKPVSDSVSCDDGALEDLPVALVRLDGEGTILFANAAARRLLKAEMVQKTKLDALLEGLAKPIPNRVTETLAGKAQGRSEVARGRNMDGYFQVNMSRVTRDGEDSILAVLSDATELKTLEAQFVQSQKMQAVGQLAGGIAHDFNNLLTAINGHCDLLLLRHAQGDAAHADLMQIRQNSNRAAALVRQLLAFSRKQTLRPQVLHLFDTLTELANLLNRLIGEKVQLKLDISEDIWPVRVDERQLEQVIVNLVVNARDAMPAGGVVTVSTRNTELTEPLVRDRATVAPGRYSLIEVRDTGTGIPQDKITKIFEPFFTTKRVGEGTGLGLSTVYGIIKQTDGFIFVDSTLGGGSLFTIYLPVVEGEVAAASAKTVAVEARKEFRDPTGRGTVLLVEDEAPVRSFASRALQMRGYSVLEAENGEAALRMLEEGDLAIDLIVSDVVMPGMDGPTWVREAYKRHPKASTIFVSGYSQDQFSDDKPEIPRSSYLPKPFTLDDLTERVREHMDRYVNH